MPIAVVRFPKYVSTISPGRRTDAKYDGFLIGAGGSLFSPGVTIGEVAAVRPVAGEPVGRALFVNGVMHDVTRASRLLEEVADSTGLELVGLYNAADGISDVFQVMADRLPVYESRACRVLAGVLVEELNARRKVRLLAYSQGAQVTSIALSDVRVALLKQGMMPAEVDVRLASVQVETFGSSCSNFPDGPLYRHAVNLADPVASGSSLPDHEAQGPPTD